MEERIIRLTQSELIDHIRNVVTEAMTLEPDNRTKKQWDALLEQLKMSLNNRI